MRPLAAIVAVCLLGSLAVAEPLSSFTADAATKSVSAKSLLAKLRVKAEDHSKRYSRAQFGYNTVDSDGDGCSTRKEVLIRDAIKIKSISPSCAVSGKWKSSYDGQVTTNPNALEVDHLVPLAEAWYSGARHWSAKKKIAFGNDLGYASALQPVTKKQNQLKGAGDPGDWMPKKDRCDYVAAWIGVKTRWKLTIDPPEKWTLARYLVKCDSLKVLRPATPDVTLLATDRLNVGSAPTASDSQTPDPEPAEQPAPAPVSTLAPAPVIGTTPVAAPVTSCPAGKLFGDIASIRKNPTADPGSYYVHYTVTGFVRNDSNATVSLSSLPPQVTYYSASGTQVDLDYGDWNFRSDLKVGKYGGMELPPGASATWTKTDGLMSVSDWNLASFATGNATGSFTSFWASDSVPYTCADPTQLSNTRTTFPITH